MQYWVSIQKIGKTSKSTLSGLTAVYHLKPIRYSAFMPMKPDTTAGLSIGESQEALNAVQCESDGISSGLHGTE